MWMNKSLKYGVLIIPYWPMKAWWATRKVRIPINFSVRKWLSFMISLSLLKDILMQTSKDHISGEDIRCHQDQKMSITASIK